MFQADGRAYAKALRQECARKVPGTVWPGRMAREGVADVVREVQGWRLRTGKVLRFYLTCKLVT